MKNFPHQINQVPRLVKALLVFRQLASSRSHMEDDGILGDALARSGVYTFRRTAGSVEEDLNMEHAKPPDSQGTRTCARDLRRLFHLLGFVHSDNSLAADAGRLLHLSGNPLGDEARDVWRRALDGMVLTDAGGTSHPYRVLLRLVGECAAIPASLLGLCLEASDDSEAEFGRVCGIARAGDVAAALRQTGVSEHQMRNSAKILPALARQIGDIVVDRGQCHLGRDLAQQHGAAEPIRATASVAIAQRRPYRPGTGYMGAPRRETQERPRAVRDFDPDASGRRYREHQLCLERFAAAVPSGFETYQGHYDLLVVGPDGCLLVEVKTIRNDEARQIRLALGQVLYYEHFLVEPLYEGRGVHRVVVTDVKPQEDMIHLLERHGVGVAWLPANRASGLSPLAAGAFDALGIALPRGQRFR